MVATGASAIPGLLSAVLILGGVLSGVFTVTESAAVGAIHVLVTVFFYRSLPFSAFWESVTRTIRTTAMVMVLVGTATAFAYFQALYWVPAHILQILTAISDNPTIILLRINLALLVLGMFMDMAALSIGHRRCSKIRTQEPRFRFLGPARTARPVLALLGDR